MHRLVLSKRKRGGPEKYPGTIGPIQGPYFLGPARLSTTLFTGRVLSKLLCFFKQFSFEGDTSARSVMSHYVIRNETVGFRTHHAPSGIHFKMLLPAFASQRGSLAATFMRATFVCESTVGSPLILPSRWMDGHWIQNVYSYTRLYEVH